jgi:hypothetical protein
MFPCFGARNLPRCLGAGLAPLPEVYFQTGQLIAGARPFGGKIAIGLHDKVGDRSRI